MKLFMQLSSLFQPQIAKALTGFSACISASSERSFQSLDFPLGRRTLKFHEL
jgi:hypothetical protein